MPSAEERRRARAAWPGRKLRLEDEPELDPDQLAMSPGERVAMVWQLTQDAWALTGEPLPEYDRATMPGRMIRAGSSR